MEAKRARRSLRGKVTFVVQLAVIAALAIYIVHDFNVKEFASALKHVSAWSLVPIALSEVFYYTFHALAFWALCRKKFNLTVVEAIGSSMMAWLVDIILPSAFVEGDVMRALFLKTKADWASSLSYALFFRLLISSTLVLFLLLTSLLAVNVLVLHPLLALAYVSMIGLWIILAVVLSLTLFKPTAMKGPLLKLLRRVVPSRAFERLERDLEAFLARVEDASRSLRENVAWLLVAVAALMAKWTSGIFTSYFALRAVGVEVNFFAVAPGYTLLTLFSLASIGVPFMLGSIDSALVILYTMLGVPKEAALLATFIGRSFTILVSMLLIYPLGTYYIKKTFSAYNLNDVKRMLRRISEEYGVKLPLLG